MFSRNIFDPSPVRLREVKARQTSVNHGERGLLVVLEGVVLRMLRPKSTVVQIATGMVLLSIFSGPSTADSVTPLIGDMQLRDLKCRQAFHRYLSCFAGENLSKCKSKAGAKFCSEEAELARGDLAAAWISEEEWGQKQCAPMYFYIIEENLRRYKRGWDCKPW